MGQGFQKFSVEAEVVDSSSSVLEQIRAAYQAYLDAIKNGVPETDAAKAAFGDLIQTADGLPPTLWEARSVIQQLGGSLDELDAHNQVVVLSMSDLIGTSEDVAYGMDSTGTSAQALSSELSSIGESAADADSALGAVGTTAAHTDVQVKGANATSKDFGSTLTELGAVSQLAQEGFGGFIDSVKGGAGPLAIGATAVGALAMGLGQAALAAADEEVGVVRLETAMRNMSGVTEQQIADTAALIDARQSLAYADDELRDNMARLLFITNDLDAAQRLQLTAMDLSRGTGMDLVSASRMVGVVYEGNSSILRRWGIILDETASKEEALAALQQRFAGQAEGYAQTNRGALDIIGTALENINEALGTGVLERLNEAQTRLSGLGGTAEESAGRFQFAMGAVEGLGGAITDKALSPINQLASDWAALEGIFGNDPTGLARSWMYEMGGDAAAMADELKVQGGRAGEEFAGTLYAEIVARENDIASASDNILDILDITDDGGDTGLDGGDAYTAGILAALEAGLPGLGSAAAMLVKTMDKSEQSATVGSVIGTALVNAATSKVSGGMQSLFGSLQQQVNAALAALGAQGIKLPDIKLPTYKSSAAALGFDRASAAEQRGGSAARAAAAAAQGTVANWPGTGRERLGEVADIAAGFGDDVEDDYQRAGRAANSRARKAAARKNAGGSKAGRGGRAKSAEQLARDAERAAEALERANERVDDAMQGLDEYSMQSDIADAQDLVTEATERKREAAEAYSDLIDAQRDKVEALNAEEKAASAETVAALEEQQAALREVQAAHEEAQHAIQVELHHTQEEFEELEAAALAALAPLEADARAAAEGLRAIQDAAADAREATTQALWPLQDQLREIEQQEEQVLGAYDDQLQAIGDRMFELAQAERAALGPLQDRIEAQQRVVDGAQEHADAIGLQLSLLRQQEDSYDRLNALQEQGQEIENMRARFANASDPLERQRLEREIAEAEKRRGFSVQEGALIGQQEVADESLRLAQEELEGRRQEHDMRAQEFAERRELLQQEQEAVSRQRELAQRDFDQRRKNIEREMEAIQRRQELLDREFRLKELEAQARVDAANENLEAERARQEERLEATRARMALLQEELSDMQFRDQEDERLKNLEIARTSERLAAIREHYAGRREAINEDIKTLQAHQKAAEEAGQAEIEKLQGILQPLKDAYDAWKEINRESQVNERLTDALEEQQEAREEYAASLGAIGTAAKDAAPHTQTLTTKTTELATSVSDKAVPAIGDMTDAIGAFLGSPEMAALLASLDRGTAGTLAYDFVHAWDRDLEDSYTKLFNTSLNHMAIGLDLYRNAAGPMWEEIANDANTAMDSMITKMGDVAEAYAGMPPGGSTAGTSSTTGLAGFGYTAGGYSPAGQRDMYLPRTTTSTNTNNQTSISLVIQNSGDEKMPTKDSSRAEWQGWLQRFVVEYRYARGG